MLGINTKRTLITGKFADTIRQNVSRVNRCVLNEQDKDIIRKNQEITSKYTVVWK